MINIIDNGTAQCIINKCSGVQVGVKNPTHTFHTNPTVSGSEGKAINSCTGAYKIMVDKDSYQDFRKVLELQEGAPVSYLYSMFNGKVFSPFLEISYSSKLWTGDVGIDVGFTKGSAFMVPSDDVAYALKEFNTLRELLTTWGYVGEVAIAIGENFTAVDVHLGHNWAFFALYGECAMGGVASVLDFLTDTNKELDIYDTCLVANLVSTAPFPALGQTSIVETIRAPVSAEKHLWRVRTAGYEPVLVTTHGKTVSEAKRRLTRTIQNCLAYDRDLQYRIDYGRKDKFIFSVEKCNARLYQKEESPTRGK